MITDPPTNGPAREAWFVSHVRSQPALTPGQRDTLRQIFGIGPPAATPAPVAPSQVEAAA